VPVVTGLNNFQFIAQGVFIIIILFDQQLDMVKHRKNKQEQ